MKNVAESPDCRQDVLDNMLAAMARIIFTAPTQVQLDFFAVDWLQKQPLYADLEEGSTVLKALLVLLDI